MKDRFSEDLINFLCFLVDNKEQEFVSEENICAWLGEYAKSKKYRNNLPCPAELKTMDCKGGQ